MGGIRTITLAGLLLLTELASGQASRIVPSKTRPRLTLGDTITLTASPATVTFTLHENQLSTGSAAVAITTTYTGVSLLGSFILYGYFASASSALSGGSPVAYIPSSKVLGQVPTGTPTTYTAFTSTGPFGGAGASLQLYSNGAALSLGGNRTDYLSLEINLVGVTQQPAATYTGMLTLEVQAF